MTKLRLIKGSSYMYKGYSFTRNRAVDVDDKDSKYLIDTGHFEQISDNEVASEEAEAEEELDELSEEAEAVFTEEPAEAPKKTTKKSK